jgi:ATP-dependent protease ClpP protease subunit
MELIDILKNKKSDNLYTKAVVNLHEFYLLGDIETPDNYIDWFDIIRHAGENDIIKIYINSYGGDLFAAIQFMRVLSESAATKIISVEGACCSAATMIFLCADRFEVTPHSVFMFHNYSAGVFGKGGEMFDQLQHERKWSACLMNEIYKDFMTEQEIKSMLENKDIWMDGEEVVKRLEKRLAAKKFSEKPKKTTEKVTRKSTPVKASPEKKTTRKKAE